jgi:hypothetical protein
MITPGRIKELLERKPFRPFRLCLSDGSSHAVPHPEFAWVYGGRIFVGSPGDNGPDSVGPLKELAILHVTRVEEQKPQKRKDQDKKK